MDYRTPLHLLRHLLPSRAQPDASARAPDFMDTQPVDHGPSASPTDTPVFTPPQFQGSAWAESAIDLAQGTEIMEFPDDAAADLMGEFFAQTDKRAA